MQSLYTKWEEHPDTDKYIASVCSSTSGTMADDNTRRDRQCYSLGDYNE